MSQLIIESCLSAAERNYDEQPGRHTEQFMDMLPLAIAADMEATSPTSLGPDAPRDESTYTISRSARMGAITLNSVEL